MEYAKGVPLNKKMANVNLFLVVECPHPSQIQNVLQTKFLTGLPATDRVKVASQPHHCRDHHLFKNSAS